MPNSNLKYLPLVAFLFLSLSYLEGTQATKLVLPGVTKIYPTTEPTTTPKVVKTNRPWEVTKGYLNPTTTVTTTTPY
ncbi:hypothetical protein CC1G_14042 [Coprinopsis cinerea okayama7|uniref:Uncharacterized protein n=1 Tax=Coprinopsis cinerea (strain Okayama-7 / 130 / ATCC MYA-4618 / FGSC 9003) TaxID=240176 RepID=D6RL18_COPC7|nr:hypothetical protein CC1G_14042 [Coprinopsis cinerea okayama7\|eukprot:XP_002912004.1 hypothetical protein CC1G_14042 [Coprinopsis cinerea okayama7\